MTRTLSTGRIARLTLRRLFMAVGLTIGLLTAIVPSVAAISQPGGISDGDWNSTWAPAGTWPPTVSAGWPTPATNPALNARCGIDIAVVVDRSGSIADAGQGAAYKAAVTTLVDAFAGTPSKLGVWSFASKASDTAPATYPWHQMSQLDGASGPANVAALKATVDSIPILTGFSTNWEEGIRSILTVPVVAAPKPDLVVVLTDGQPTVHADDSGSGGTTNNDDMAGGVLSANLVKANGTRVMAVGVGPTVNVAGLKLISGPTAFNGLNISTADYLTTSFADLSASLQDFATSICGGSVTVTKEASSLAAPGTFVPAAGWTFTGDVVNPETAAVGSPGQPATVATNDGLTGGDGQVIFTWKSVTDETVTITETQQPGFELVSRSCTLNGQAHAFTEAPNGVQLTVPQGENVRCTLRNRPVFIDLSVTKTDGKVATSPGEVNDYAITYANAADATASATDVTLTETVPANTVYVAAGSAAWSCADGAPAGSVCTLNVGAVAPGAGGTVHFKVQVLSPVAAGVTQIANTVGITGAGTERDLGDQSATDVDSLNASPELSVTKGDGEVTAVPGGLITYDIDYLNSGDQAATGVVLVETVPLHTTFVGAGSPGWDCNGVAAGNGDGAGAGASCTNAVGNVAGGGAGGSRVFQVRVVNPVPAGVTNVANVVLIDDDICVTSCDSDDEDTPLDAAPELSVTKGDGGVTAVPGGLITYGIDYVNSGDQAATGVVLVETVPVHTTFVGAGSPGWDCNGGAAGNGDGAVAGASCTNAVGNVAGGGAGGSRVFQVRVVNPVPAGVTNVANVVLIDDDICVTSCDSDDEDTPLDASPIITVAKTDGKEATFTGDTLLYSITVTNVGNQDATDVDVLESLPAHTSFLADDPANAAWVPLGLGQYLQTIDVSVGVPVVLTFKVQVAATVPEGTDTVLNLVSACLPTQECDSDTDTDILDAAPDLSLAKDDGVLTAGPGQVLTYVIDYANTGDEGVTAVSLAETVPVHTTASPATLTGLGWVCADGDPTTPAVLEAGSACTNAIGDLAGGTAGSTTFEVTVDATVPADATTVVNVVGLVVGAETVLTDDDVDTLTHAAALTIAKTDGDVTVDLGDEVTYVITYANTGAKDATGVVITETVPVGSTFVAGSSDPGWVCADVAAGSECAVAVGDLAAGASGTVDFTVLVADALPVGQTQLDNVVTISDDDCEGVCAEGTDETPVRRPVEVLPNVIERPAATPAAAPEVKGVTLARTGADVHRFVVTAGLLTVLGAWMLMTQVVVDRRRQKGLVRTP